MSSGKDIQNVAADGRQNDAKQIDKPTSKIGSSKESPDAKGTLEQTDGPKTTGGGPEKSPTSPKETVSSSRDATKVAASDSHIDTSQASNTTKGNKDIPISKIQKQTMGSSPPADKGPMKQEEKPSKPPSDLKQEDKPNDPPSDLKKDKAVAAKDETQSYPKESLDPNKQKALDDSHPEAKVPKQPHPSIPPDPKKIYSSDGTLAATRDIKQSPPNTEPDPKKIKTPDGTQAATKVPKQSPPNHPADGNPIKQTNQDGASPGSNDLKQPTQNNPPRTDSRKQKPTDGISPGGPGAKNTQQHVPTGPLDVGPGKVVCLPSVGKPQNKLPSNEPPKPEKKDLKQSSPLIPPGDDPRKQRLSDGSPQGTKDPNKPPSSGEPNAKQKKPPNGSPPEAKGPTQLPPSIPPGDDPRKQRPSDGSPPGTKGPNKPPSSGEPNAKQQMSPDGSPPEVKGPKQLSPSIPPGEDPRKQRPSDVSTLGTKGPNKPPSSGEPNAKQQRSPDGSPPEAKGPKQLPPSIPPGEDPRKQRPSEDSKKQPPPRTSVSVKPPPKSSLARTPESRQTPPNNGQPSGANKSGGPPVEGPSQSGATDPKKHPSGQPGNKDQTKPVSSGKLSTEVAYSRKHAPGNGAQSGLKNSSKSPIDDRPPPEVTKNPPLQQVSDQTKPLHNKPPPDARDSKKLPPNGSPLQLRLDPKKPQQNKHGPPLQQGLDPKKPPPNVTNPKRPSPGAIEKRPPPDAVEARNSQTNEQMSPPATSPSNITPPVGSDPGKPPANGPPPPTMNPIPPHTSDSSPPSGSPPDASDQRPRKIKRRRRIKKPPLDGADPTMENPRRSPPDGTEPVKHRTPPDGASPPSSSPKNEIESPDRNEHPPSVFNQKKIPPEPSDLRNPQQKGSPTLVPDPKQPGSNLQKHPSDVSPPKLDSNVAPPTGLNPSKPPPGKTPTLNESGPIKDPSDPKARKTTPNKSQTDGKDPTKTPPSADDLKNIPPPLPNSSDPKESSFNKSATTGPDAKKSPPNRSLTGAVKEKRSTSDRPLPSSKDPKLPPSGTTRDPKKPKTLKDLKKPQKISSPSTGTNAGDKASSTRKQSPPGNERVLSRPRQVKPMSPVEKIREIQTAKLLQSPSDNKQGTDSGDLPPISDGGVQMQHPGKRTPPKERPNQPGNVTPVEESRIPINAKAPPDASIIETNHNTKGNASSEVFLQGPAQKSPTGKLNPLRRPAKLSDSFSDVSDIDISSPRASSGDKSSNDGVPQGSDIGPSQKIGGKVQGATKGPPGKRPKSPRKIVRRKIKKTDANGNMLVRRKKRRRKPLPSGSKRPVTKAESGAAVDEVKVRERLQANALNSPKPEQPPMTLSTNNPQTGPQKATNLEENPEELDKEKQALVPKDSPEQSTKNGVNKQGTGSNVKGNNSELLQKDSGVKNEEKNVGAATVLRKDSNLMKPAKNVKNAGGGSNNQNNKSGPRKKDSIVKKDSILRNEDKNFGKSIPRKGSNLKQIDSDQKEIVGDELKNIDQGDAKKDILPAGRGQEQNDVKDRQDSGEKRKDIDRKDSVRERKPSGSSDVSPEKSESAESRDITPKKKPISQKPSSRKLRSTRASEARSKCQRALAKILDEAHRIKENEEESSTDGQDNEKDNTNLTPKMSAGDKPGSGGGNTGTGPGSGTTEATNGPKTPPTGPRKRMLHYAMKSDWSGVEGVLRSANRGDSEIMAVDQETGVTTLMLAAGENKLPVVERLLELGAPINGRATDGRTAMHYAALTAKDDMMRMLVSRKADATFKGGPLEQLPIHMAATRFSGGLFHVQTLLKISGKDVRLAIDKDGSIPLVLAAEAGNLAVGRELLAHDREEQLKVKRLTNGDTPLHAACRKKDFDFIKLCVDCGAQVDAKNKDGQTPLHLSAAEGDEAAIKFFYQARANPHVFDKLDRSPVHIAAEHGHTSCVELLVEKFKASVSARTKDGSTLMHVASQCGHPETALMFLKKGVPLHMPNKSGAVCLHAASMRGHTAVVKALLQKGAQVDARTKDNYTALHLAVEHCKPLVVQTLLGHGAQVQLKGGKHKETPLHIAARIKDGEKVAEMLLKSGADVNVPMSNGETAIHIASRHGFLKMVQELLEEGSDPVCCSQAGENPLHIAIRHCHLPVVKELINFLHNEMSMMDVVLAVNAQSMEGESPLHYAAEITKDMIHYPNEDIEIITTMLKYDADINIVTKLTQETALHYCARAGNADILMQMVKHLGPNRTQLAVNRQSKNGWSPLLVASEQGHVEIVKILLQHNARVDVFDEHGKAALHLAAENGHLEVADILLWHKAFVNAKSKLGVTPLHLGAQNGHNELVKLLIQTHNATIDALSLVKKTPLHMAAQNGKLEVCQTLLRMKADSNATDITEHQRSIQGAGYQRRPSVPSAKHGQTPLHLAAENDHADIVKFFLKHKPEIVTLANSDGSTCAHIAASKGSVAVIKELLRFDRIGVTTAKNKTNDSTALHLAAAGGHKEVVSVLIDAGASPTEEDADGMTAIHMSGKNGHVGVMDVLKSKISLKTTSVKTGLAALHVAAHYGQVDFVRDMLTKVPATIRSEAPSVIPADMKDLPLNDHGFTPLHLAAQSGHEGLVRLLLNSPGVQPDVPTIVQGTIPLHLAAQSGHSAVVGLLLSKSTTQLHVKDKRGRTGLHMAAANGHYDMVALLLGQGSDINTFDKNGWTALHFAAKAGFLNVVKLLVESGASPKFETKDGKVPICYAAAANHQPVLTYLTKQDLNTYHLMEDKKFVFDLMVSGKYTNNKSLKEFILKSHAPIDTAGKLSRNFHIQSTKEKERARELLDAAAFCESMAVDLLSVAASVSSAGQLLKAVDNRGITILDVLIECEQKEVIAHPSVQRYLSDVWMGSLKWSGFKIIMLFFAFIIFPPIWIFFSLPIKQRFNKLPIIKFMSLVVSHIYLILFLCMTTVITELIEEFIVSQSLLPRWYEWFLLAWLSGLLLSEITNPEDRAGLGWIRVVILVLAAIAFTLHVVAFGFKDNPRRDLIYGRNQLLAWCLLLAFAQILEFLIFHHLFGPWAIIIRDLMKDLVRFMVILLIFLVGFMLHLAAVYQPVYPKTGTTADQQLVQSPADTFPILFFSLFGLVEPVDLPSTARHPAFTHILIRIVFGTYLIVTLIVLINLLIAMMSDTYQRIQAQSDTEWKFGRAKLIRKMNKSSTTPSPINLFTKLYTYLKAAYKHKGKVCSAQARQYIDHEEELDAISDSRSVDMYGGHGNSGGGGGGGGGGWFAKHLGGRRNTQVTPEGGGFLRANNAGPQRIEDVVNWEMVGKRYLSIKGDGDDDEDVKKTDEDGDADAESNGVGPANNKE